MAQGVVDKLVNSPRKQLLVVQGGTSRGDPCEAFAYHGFNGVEAETVKRIAEWVAGK